jgi:REP element-mobilizing transposase RayT
MSKIVGFMATWTTYGTWLQGDERRYVKDGKTLDANKNLKKANLQSLKKDVVKLKKSYRSLVKQTILTEAKTLGQMVRAISVYSNHVHIVVEKDKYSIEYTVGRYKRAATVALRKRGMQGRIWTKGFDKRFCFDNESLQKRTKYVLNHKD